jgi:hypothetical protein
MWRCRIHMSGCYVHGALRGRAAVYIGRQNLGRSIETRTPGVDLAGATEREYDAASRAECRQVAIIASGEIVARFPIFRKRTGMEYTKLGRTGLDVSRICLGCMSYGGGNQGNHAWSLGEEESRPFIKKALENGINFFDTANHCCPVKK